jgi:hypothetical protein
LGFQNNTLSKNLQEYGNSHKNRPAEVTHLGYAPFQMGCIIMMVNMESSKRYNQINTIP